MDLPEAAVAGRGACGCVPVSDKWVSRAHLCLECPGYRDRVGSSARPYALCLGGSVVRISARGFDRPFS